MPKKNLQEQKDKTIINLINSIIENTNDEFIIEKLKDINIFIKTNIL